MSLFDNLEKLVNERGSAAIMRERLSLAEDKYAALERKLANAREDHEQQVAKLKAEVGKVAEELKSRQVSLKLSPAFLRALEAVAPTNSEDHVRLACVHTLWSFRPDRAKPLLEDALGDLRDVNRAHAQVLLDLYDSKSD